MNTNERNVAYTTPRQDIFEMIPLSAVNILDVGCSNGALGRSLISNRTDRIVFGVEFDPVFAEEARQYLSEVINVDLNVFDWSKAFRQNQFDCIIFADVLEHLTDPHLCLMQALKYLKPGGSIVISLPNIRHLSALWAIYILGSFPRRDRGIFDRTHLRWFTFTDALLMFSSIGLKVANSSQALRWGDTGGGVLNRLLNRLPNFVKRITVIREFLTYQMCFRLE